MKSGLIAQYLLNVCDEIGRKIAGLVVKHAIDPTLLQIIFTHNLYDVTLLEVEKSRLGAHVIIKRTDILHFLKIKNIFS